MFLLGFQIWNTSLSSHHTCPDCICINLLFVSVWIIWSTIIQLPWNWWRWPLEHSNTGCQMPVCSAHKMGVELAPSRSSLHNPFILAKVSFFCVLQWCFLESAGAKSRKASNPNYWITHCHSKLKLHYTLTYSATHVYLWQFLFTRLSHKENCVGENFVMSQNRPLGSSLSI